MSRRQLTGMLAPYVTGLVLLVFAPAVATVVLAFTEWDLITAPRWVGLGNMTELTRSDAFRAALRNSLWFALIATPLRLVFACGLALLLNRRSRGVGVARTAALVPTAMPEVAYGLLWLWLLNPLYGPVNQLLTLGGVGGRTAWGALPPQWLTVPGHARAGIILMSVFTVGEAVVLILATRRAISPHLYELATVEGARPWQVLRRVTLPLLAPVLAVLLLRDTIAGFGVSFTPALVVTDGGPPQYGTTYLSLFVYRNAFEYLRYGYAAAATVVMLAVTVAAVLLQWSIIRRHRLVNG